MVYDAPPPPGSVLLGLQRVAHASAHALAAELTALDLTGSDINALANLAARPGQTVSELAAACGARPTTLTGVLDRLERRGHITRGSRAGDRRSVLVDLTHAGRRAADTINTAIARAERRALAGLPAEAVTGFHAVLHALAEEIRHDRA